METFDVSQEIDLSYMEEKIEKSLAATKTEKLKTRTVSHPPVKCRKEKVSEEKESVCSR